MNFYVDSGGVVLHVEPERIFQGSASSNTIRFIGAFASNLPVLVAFKLPNGVWTTPQSMGFSAQLSGVETNDGVQFNTWEYQIPQVITENYGTVNVQFYVYGDAGGTGGQIASAMSSFVVEKGVPITLPDPTDDYQTLLTQILAVLSQIQSEIGDLPNNYVPKASGSNVAYINDQNGGTATKPFAVDVTNNALVARDGNGQIRVPLAPLQGYDATSKNYVDESIEALPSKYVTLDTDQTIDGTKGFTSPITVGGQTWRTSYMKDSFVYTVDGYSYEVTYPEKSGLMALKSDIPTDYATQGQLAQTNQNVEDLYTILEQAQVVTVTTLEQAYTTRETADGENIVDGVQTTVKEIRGKTLATENLIPYPYAETTKTQNGVTFTVNSDGTITVNGTATKNTSFFLVFENPTMCLNLRAGENYTLSGCPKGGSDTTFSMYIQDISYTQSIIDYGNGATKAISYTQYYAFIRIAEGYTANNLVFRPMLNTGSEAKPYSKWFPGLKNAFFKEIVSTGKNLIDLSGVSLEKTVNGVTFTKISDGLYRVTGTIADPSQEASPTVNINQGKVYPAGVYSTARYTVDGKDIEFFVSAYSAKTGAPIRNIDGANININEDFVIRSAGIYVNRAITGAIDLTVSTILNFGSSALPYEPYTSDTLSVKTPIELAEYDVAYPETGEIQRQSKTLTFNGTEYFAGYPIGDYFIYAASLQVYGTDSSSGIANNDFVFQKTESGDDMGVYIAGEKFNTINFWFRKTIFPELNTTDKFKAQLAAWNEAGNPLTVTYKTAEATTEATPFDKSKYIAWKNGSETIEQGSTDNSEYGAENTVKQDYFTLTGGTTNV